MSDDPNAPTAPVSISVSDADAASAPAQARRRAAAKAVAPAELAKTLRQAVGSGSVLLAQLLEVPDVAMSADEAQSIADPLARILGRSKLLKQLTRKLVSSSDWLDLAFASAMYGLRIYPLVYAKLQENAIRERTRRAQHASPLQHSDARGSSGDTRAAAASAAGNGASNGAGATGLAGLVGWHPGAEPLEGWAVGNAG